MTFCVIDTTYIIRYNNNTNIDKIRQINAVNIGDKMKKSLLRVLTAVLLAAFVLAFVTSCESIVAPIEKGDDTVGNILNNAETESDRTSTESDSGTEYESESESETESESVTETEEDSETEEVTSDETTENSGTTILEFVFSDGEFRPYETTAAETQPPDTSSVPVYNPSYPQSGGIAPLALMYHLVLDEPYTDLVNLFVRPDELEGQIQALIEAGYTFIFADEYAYSDTKTVIMSFDDGYIDNYTEMFPIIKKYNVKVTVFMISGYIGGENFLTEDMIREMASSGLVSFQSHTQNHPGLTSLSADSLRYEFETSRRTIEALTGREVKAICYPSGRYNDTVLSVASEYFDFGYTTVSLNSTAGYPLLTLPRLRVNRGYSKSYFASIIP